MRTLTHAIALLAALATLGCSAMVDPAKNDPLQTAEGFCNSIQDAAMRLPCGSAPAALEQQFAFLRTGCDTLQTAVDAGRYAYDPGMGAACIAAIERMGCRGVMSSYAAAPNFAWPQACRDALRGAVPTGGVCTYQEGASGDRQAYGGYSLNECQEGSGCYGDATSAAGATCQRPGVEGDFCGTGRPCESWLLCAGGYDLLCHTGVTGSPCSSINDCQRGYYCTSIAGGTCEIAAPAGQPCSQGSVCNVTSYCPIVNGTCAAKPAANQPCGSANVCQDGLTCYGGICRTYATEGQSCANTACNWTTARPLYCDEGQVCRSYPVEPLPRGANCFGLGTFYCADGLYCDYSGVNGPVNTCQPQKGAGGDCGTGMAYEVCLPGHNCVPDSTAVPPTSKCQPAPGLGGACDTMYLACQPGLFCRASGSSSAGVCDALPTDGEPCTPGGMPSSCAPGHYTSWPPGGTCVCARYKQVGEGCSSDTECGYMGRRCVAAAPPSAGSTCQVVYSWEVPIGWFAMGGP